MTREEIIQKAEEVCKENNINTSPVKVTEICEHYGLKVFEARLVPEVSGFIVVQNENFMHFGTGRLIVVNKEHPATRQRFTIAHELAHYILHRNGEELYAHRDAGHKGSIEREADTFAANILMPKKIVLDALTFISEDAPDMFKIRYIAREFCVAEATAAIRLSELGIIMGG